MFHASKNALIRKRLYILVADNARARIFQATTPVKSLEVVMDKAHESGRLSDSEIYSDRAGGSRAGPGGSGGYHTYAREKSDDPEEQRFARELADQLNKACHEGLFDQLVLMAAPHFLGTLRQYLSEKCRELVLTEIDKDLAHRDTETILQHLEL